MDDDTTDDDTELTALQTIVRNREAAAALLKDLDGVEDDHDAGMWELKLELHEEDLPAVRRELREYIDDAE